MKELSLHLLDIVQNALEAEADLIKVIIKEKLDKNLLAMIIEDNGRGLSEEMKSQITDPFVTSRNTREVGLGLPFLKAAAERCQGKLEINSSSGSGTRIEAEFKHDHIDRAPLGDISGSLTGIIAANEKVDIIYRHIFNKNKFEVDTREIREELQGVKLNHPRILNWFRKHLHQNLKELRGGE